MSEPVDNIQYAHTGCLPKAGEYAQIVPALFVGRHVKKAFVVVPGAGKPSHERMWVKVTSATDDGMLTGTLENEPVYDCCLEAGEVVTLHAREIVDVVPPIEPRW